MRKGIAYSLLFLGLLLCSPVKAANPEIVEVTSAGGLKAWLVEDHKLPLVSMRFAFRGGVEQDRADQQGLAVLSASLLTQGAGPYDAAAFQERLAARSISMDVSATRDWIVGQAKTLSRTKQEAFRLLALALTKPKFEPRPFDRLRNQQIAAVKMQLSNPSWQARYALYGHIFPDHPYQQRSLGTAQSLGRLTRDDVAQFLAPRLAKDNLVIAVVGDIDRQELAEVLDEVFGALPVRADLTPVHDVLPPQRSKTIEIDREGKQTEVHFAGPMLSRKDKDWYAAEIANYILGGGGFISRLMKAVRAEEGLTYGISTGLAAMEYASVLSGSFSSENAQTGKALSLVQEVWQEFYEKGVTQEEVMAAQDYLIGSLAISLTSTDAIAQTLLAMQMEDLGRDYLDKRESFLWAVGQEDVNRVIRKWFDPRRVSYSLVGRPYGVNADEKRNLVTE
jgi:zinc protease